MPLQSPYMLRDSVEREPMPHDTKIATCCYCGTRAALVLRGRDRHELACSGCGAPLHNLKGLRPPEQRKGPRELVGTPASRRVPTRDMPDPYKRRKKKKKSLLKRAFEEAFDVIEDIFD